MTVARANSYKKLTTCYNRQNMKKIIVLDIDDTLTTDGSWERLNLAAGMTAEEDYFLYKQFADGVITYNEWTLAIETHYRRHNKLTSDIARHVLTTYSLREHVLDTVHQLQTDGHRLILITGGFLTTAAHVANQLAIDDYYAVTDIIFFEEGTFEKFVSQGEEGEAKLNILTSICEQESINIRDCIAVGDSINDIPLFRATGNGVTFSWTKQIVQDAAKYIIEDWSNFPSL
jgi:glucosyl-3-phosphoglycerate synthase